MKPRAKNKEEILSETLNLFGKVSPEDAEDARVQTLKYLTSHKGEVDQAQVSDAVSARRSPLRPWLAVATVAAAIALAVVLPTPIVQSAPAVLEDASGSRKIQYGEVVRPSGDMSAMLAMTGGARVEVHSMSELSLERADDGIRIRLNNGGVIVDAAAQHNENLYVQTKDVMASVGGAVSLVKADEEGSRVAAIGGEVRVQQGTTETRLQSGEQIASNPKMESLAVKEELTWSRQAGAHVAMLVQAVRIPTSRPPTPSAAREEKLAFELATIRVAAPAPAPGPNARGGGGGGLGHAACDGFSGQGDPLVQLDPRRFGAKGVSLYELIGLAYGRCSDLDRFGRLSGGPEWIKSIGWDIEALIGEGAVDPLPTGFNGPVPELWDGRSPKVQKMIRTLLEERFKVAVRRETKEMPVYVLTVAAGGTKFQGNNPNIPRGAVFGFMGPDGKLMTPAEGASSSRISGAARCDGNPCVSAGYFNVYMDDPTGFIAGQMGRPVLDRTGIQEKVSFRIEWPRDPGYNAQLPTGPPPSLGVMNKALENIGLHLTEESKGQVEVFVIERAEKPSEN